MKSPRSLVSRLRASCLLAALALPLLPPSASAEGFLEAVRHAMFGRFQEARPTYPAVGRRGSAGETPWGAPAGFAVRHGGFREQSTTRRISAGEQSPIGGGGSQLLCVRLCDGYVFPLGGNGRSLGGWSSAEASCDASCPGSTTAVYKGGSVAEPSGARAADGSRYRQLATAFLFRKERPAQCSCGTAEPGSRLSLLSDPTLRRGDIVVAADGSPRVFTGSKGASHAPEDFGPVQGSKALSRSAQTQVALIMGPGGRTPSANSRVVQIDVPRGVRAPGIAQVEAPAGTAGNVRVFTVGSGGEGAVRTVGGPAIYVIR